MPTSYSLKIRGREVRVRTLSFSDIVKQAKEIVNLCVISPRDLLNSLTEAEILQIYQSIMNATSESLHVAESKVKEIIMQV